MQKLILILLFMSSFSFAGRDGNGGNEIALRFTQIASKSLDYLESPGKNSQGLDLNKLRSAIEDTKVYTVSYKLCADDSDKACPSENGFVAKNYPGKHEILINADRWKALSQEEKIRIVMHEYLGIMDVEAAKYNISSSIILALDHIEGQEYSCSLSLIEKTSYRPRVLGSANFLVRTDEVRSLQNKSQIKNSPNDVVFRVVAAKDYIRGTVMIARLVEDTPFILVDEKKEVIFENMTFFEGEPVGVKVFKTGNKLLQVACSHI